MQLLARARIHALPSFGEVVSLANQEACSLGVPAVMSYVGAEPEYFGAGGFYCNPTDPGDIARAIADAWGAPRGVWAEMPTWDEVAKRGIEWMEVNR
jgi:glycosyltransferase involved in cell wall biosynthesis